MTLGIQHSYINVTTKQHSASSVITPSVILLTVIRLKVVAPLPLVLQPQNCHFFENLKAT
jgi:hypothetical protein